MCLSSIRLWVTWFDCARRPYVTSFNLQIQWSIISLNVHHCVFEWILFSRCVLHRSILRRTPEIINDRNGTFEVRWTGCCSTCISIYACQFLLYTHTFKIEINVHFTRRTIKHVNSRAMADLRRIHLNIPFLLNF